MDLEWKKFSDEWPECKLIWFSDYSTVWLKPTNTMKNPKMYKISDMENEENSKFVWAEANIQYPDPPKKERHKCQHYDLSICYESEYGDLRLAINNSTYIPIKFCPFCGFSKEKK